MPAFGGNVIEIAIQAKEDAIQKMNDTAAAADKMGGSMVRVGAVFATAAGTIAVAMGRIVFETAKAAESMNEMALRVGDSASNLSRWKIIAEDTGTSIEAIIASSRFLAKAAVEDADALKRLGVAATDAQGNTRPLMDLFSDVIDALSEMDNAADRNAIAMQLLGRGAIDLAAIYGTSTEELRKMKEELDSSGAVMSDKLTKAAHELDTELERMHHNVAAVKNFWTEAFVGPATKVLGILNDINDVLKSIQNTNPLVPGPGIPRVTAGPNGTPSRPGQYIPVPEFSYPEKGAGSQAKIHAPYVAPYSDTAYGQMPGWGGAWGGGGGGGTPMDFTPYTDTAFGRQPGWMGSFGGGGDASKGQDKYADAINQSTAALSSFTGSIVTAALSGERLSESLLKAAAQSVIQQGIGAVINRLIFGAVPFAGSR